ncbi:hypothetical protein ABEB36_007019 [Hypothenemus hampei]|uniref:Uncharacterized protein n=1 Tax=Hypothenemus hampei TaxID=57062 RepID=A0ABD1ETC0_HYPHA
MVPKPFKISSEIISTCNKLFSSSTDASLKTKLPLAVYSQKDVNLRQPRYKITNVERPTILPDLQFEFEPNHFADLQPNTNPGFRAEFKTPKWADQSDDPFPPNITADNKIQHTYNDQQIAEERFLKYKMSRFHSTNRKFSTLFPKRSFAGRNFSGKPPADNTSDGTCAKKVKGCVKTKFRECRITNKDCPRLKLLDCQQSKGSNCKLNYLYPNCTKKFAPYPSYSEACAETLPDDPSECNQCPWRTCDGAETIEPGKPVRGRRNYSTSSSKHLDSTTGVVVDPIIPSLINLGQDHQCKSSGSCGQTKRPCKQPPGLCEVRRQKDEEKKREKLIHIPPKPKKASEKLVLNGVNEMKDEVPYLGSNLNQTLSWINFNNQEMVVCKKNQPPNCKRRRKPKKPQEKHYDPANKPKCNIPVNRKTRDDPNFY